MKATKDNFNLYNNRQRPRAQDLRRRMTKAEACLWKYALRAKMTGYTFNRQRPVMNYIADFMCKDLKLIIEVDGLIHTEESVMANDNIRQQALEQAGFKVIRFRNDEVLRDMGNVQLRIEQAIRELKVKGNFEISSHQKT